MLLFYELIKGGFYTTNRVLTLPPAISDIIDYLCLFLLAELDVEGSSSFLLHQNTLIQNHSSISPVLLFIIILEDCLPCKLLLPKRRTVVDYLNGIFKQSIVNTIRIAFFQLRFKLFYPFFKVLSCIQFEVQLSMASDLNDGLILF